MTQILKRLRKCDDLNILLVSHDDVFFKNLNDIFNNTNQINILKKNSDVLDKLTNNTYDIIILDTKSDNFVEILESTTKLNIEILKIVILNDMNDTAILDSINNDVYTILAKPFDLSNLKLSIIMSLNQSKRKDKIKLAAGFYFDVYRDRVYNKNGYPVDLTKLELALLKLLIEKRGSIVDYDSIQENVWKGKNMSVFTMRNVVNKLRSKTDYAVFDNASSKGYILS